MDFLVSNGYWVFLLLAASGSIVAGIFFGKLIMKQICFVLAAIFFAFLLYEFYLKLTFPPGKEKAFVEGTYKTQQYFDTSALLGYKPGKDGTFTSRKTTASGFVVYDVTYTIRNGIRYTPNTNINSDTALIFFGCSNTFGEGMADTTTFPYYFNQYRNKRYRILNYGFHGYGPHQMLAIVERKLWQDLNRLGIKHAMAYYSFIPDHIRRCAGYSTWDNRGPRYEIIDGKLIQDGVGSRKEPLIFHSKLLTRIWTSSSTYLANFSPGVRKPTSYDVNRALEVVKRTDSILGSMGINFEMISYNDREVYKLVDKEKLDFFYGKLKQSNVRIYFTNDMVDHEILKENPFYYSMKSDGHPTAAFHRVIGAYVSANSKIY